MKILFTALTDIGSHALESVYIDLNKNEAHKLKKHKVELGFFKSDIMTKMEVRFNNKAFDKLGSKMPGVLKAIASATLTNDMEPSLLKYNAVKEIDYNSEVIL